jgi:hypothetical protein
MSAFAITCTWRRATDDATDQRPLDAALMSTDGVALVPSSVAVATRCELLLTCTADAVESAGVVSIVLSCSNSSTSSDGDSKTTAQLVVNGGQDSCAMSVARQAGGALLFEAAYDVHPRMTSSLRIKFANLLAAPTITLSALHARMHRSKRLDAPRPPLSQLMQMFVPPSPSPAVLPLPHQQRPAEPTSLSAAAITRADLDAMEQRLLRHIDLRFDALIALLTESSKARQSER